MSTAISWTDWPARRHPARAALALLVILGSVGAVATIDPLLAFLGALLLLGAVAQWLLPTRYEVGDSGIGVRNLFLSVHRDWDRLGRWAPTHDGFVLEGRTRSPMLRRLRGLSVRCTGERAEIEAVLRERLGGPVTRERSEGDARTRAGVTDGPGAKDR